MWSPTPFFIYTHKEETLTGIRIILLAGFVMNFTSVFAQEDTNPKKAILRTMYLGPKANQYQWFEEGLADHMEKHHPADGWRVGVWTVEKGKRVGQYFYGSTTHTWEDFDARVMSPGDYTHWDKYVKPYIENIGPKVFWRTLPDITISAEKVVTKAEVNYYYLYLYTQHNFMEFMGKLKPALEETGDPYTYNVYIKESGGYIPVIAIAVHLGGWMDFEPYFLFSTNIYKAMVNKYGEEEAKAMFDQVYKTIKWVDNEIRAFRPDLSSPAE